MTCDQIKPYIGLVGGLIFFGMCAPAIVVFAAANGLLCYE